jgi:hypothetical protein
VSNEFNKRLARLIKQNGASLRYLSKQVDIPLQTLHTWTIDSKPTDYAALKRLATALSVDLEYLMLGQPNHHSDTLPKLTLDDFIEDGGLVFEGMVKVRIEKVTPKKHNS